jgi:ABC-2 type transport system ATP-binding protein
VENDLALTVEGLTKYYNSFLAVDHIRFQVRRGEIYGFLGPNGAGKTTTIRMLCGLITPSDGRANIMGFDIQKESVKVKRQIGVVPEMSNLYDELTSFENLVFMAQLYGVPKSHREKRAEELIRLIRLEEKKETLFSGLSKGMKRNLTIAAALVHDPPLIFLDEPTSGLDVVNARNLRSMIRHLNQRGTTIFLTTHNIEEANLLCHRIAVIVKGKIIAIDSPEALKKSVQEKSMVELGMENPNLSDLLDSIKAFDGVDTVSRRQDRFVIGFKGGPPWGSFLQYLQERGVLVTSVNTLQPTLEDAFVKITGLDREMMMMEKEGKKG